jgi:hypothetical protein
MSVSVTLTPLISKLPGDKGYAGFYHGIVVGDLTGGQATFLLNNPGIPEDVTLSIDEYSVVGGAADHFYIIYTGADLPEPGFAGLYTYASYVSNTVTNALSFYREQLQRPLYLGRVGVPNVNTWGNIVFQTNTNLTSYEAWMRVRFYKVNNG